MSFVEVTFVNHCVRIYSNTRNLSMEDTVDLFSKHDFIDGYLVPRFDTLHNQDTEYLYETICKYLKVDYSKFEEVHDKNWPLLDLLGSRLIKELTEKLNISLTDAMLFYYNSIVYSRLLDEETEYRLNGVLQITKDLVDEYKKKGNN